MDSDNNVIQLRCKEAPKAKDDCESLEALVRFLRKFTQKTNLNPAIRRAMAEGKTVPLLVDNRTGKVSVQINNVMAFPRKAQ